MGSAGRLADDLKDVESRILDPRNVWKITAMELKSYSRRYDYSRARGRHVRRDRHHIGALVHGAHRRQETRPAEHHQPSVQPGASLPDRDITFPKRPRDSQYLTHPNQTALPVGPSHGRGISHELTGVPRGPEPLP